MAYVPGDRRSMSFVLAAAKPGQSEEEVADRIAARTGLGAYTSAQFARRTLVYYIQNTGIAINFGITILLGFFVGLAVATQTLYTFVIENLRQFGALKAMGATSQQIRRFEGHTSYVLGLPAARRSSWRRR